jgi:RNA polymerase sigma-70 factor (ECF subfamily)
VLAGDAQAATAFATRFQSDLFNLFCWLTRDVDLAEDLTQDTLIRCWECLRQYRGEAALRTWIHRVALSCLSAQRRADARERRTRARLAERQSTAVGEHNSEAEMRLALASALGQLPEAERRAAVLCKLQGFTLREAAAMLDVPVGTIAWQVATAVKKLRDLLRDVCPEGATPQPMEVDPDVSEGTQAVRSER